MNQTKRLTPVALGVAAILVLGGSIAFAAALPTVVGQQTNAQASPKPEKNENGGPSADHLDRILERLNSAGITTTADEFKALADKYGVGGAVRALAFAHAAGKSVADITALFDAGKGWGEIRRDLDLSIKPGIGWLLGQGQGEGHANDKAKDKSADKNATDDDADDDD